jgi:hypothetical protein
MRLSPETCRNKAIAENKKTQLLHPVGLISLLKIMMLGTTNIKLDGGNNASTVSGTK